MGPDILLGDINGFLTIDFYGKVVMRLKKLGPDLRPSAYKTERQQHFDNQEPEPLLFGPCATLVTAGYRLDRFAHSIRDIHIVCWLGDVRAFALPLPLPAVAAQPIAAANAGRRRKAKVRPIRRREAGGQ